MTDTRSPSDPGLACPYPGLRPFSSDEAHLFFGRARKIGDMLARLKTQRFLAVVGVSGCGKSSLVLPGARRPDPRDPRRLASIAGDGLAHSHHAPRQ